MPRLTIDGRAVDVPQGATLLDAAARLGIAIPTLCHLAELDPDPTCFVCVVQVEGRREMSPACATVAEEGMAVRTDTDDVRTARRTALELMLSDHVGDCVAPCTLACPAHLEVADFVRRVAAGDDAEAIEIIKRRIAMPATLGRICPRFCENACRRKGLDEAIDICGLRRFAADADLESRQPFTPPRKPATGRRAAIVGAGPAGLSAAYYLLQEGHDCTIFEAGDKAGGLLRRGIDEARLPAKLLDAEIDAVLRLGGQLRTGARLGGDVSLDELRRDFGAVLLAFGARVRGGDVAALDPRGRAVSGGKPDLEFARALGLETSPRGLKADRRTQVTSAPGVFAAGNAVSGPNYAVHAMAAGRRAAVAIDQHLRGLPVTGEAEGLHVLMRDLSESELARLYSGAARGTRPATAMGGPVGCHTLARGERHTLPPVRPGGRGAAPTQSGDAVPAAQLDDWPVHRGLTESEARAEAARCLDCDCLKRDACLLRDLAAEYGASPTRYRGARREFERDDSHDEVRYESGKCIQCGRCVRVAESAREELGLTFIGRGFTVKTAAPFSATLEAGLRRTARRCAEVCPTGALALKRRSARQGVP